LQPAFTLSAGGAGGTLRAGVAFGSSKALETALALRSWRARRSDIPFRSLLAGSALRTGGALRPLRSIRARTGGERENGRQCKDGPSESHGISSFVANAPSSHLRIAQSNPETLQFCDSATSAATICGRRRHLPVATIAQTPQSIFEIDNHSAGTALVSVSGNVMRPEPR
jgi:hypothetical protein